MNLFKITLYSALKKDFFDLLYNINCDAREYVGCTNIDRYFDIERVERQELVDIGEGVKISRPVVVERGLIGGNYMFSSLSHNGVLAIGYYEYKFKYQFTDLVNERRIEIEADGLTHTGFYDESMVMLTYYKLLRVCAVEELLLNKNMGVLKSIGDVEVRPYADMSILHSTRVLVFNSTSDIIYEFNVDTRVIRKLDIGKKIYSFASLTGVDVGVKGVFMEDGDNNFIYSLNKDNLISPVSEYDPGYLCTFIPSSSNPGDIRKGIKIYDDGSFFTNTTEEKKLTTPFKYQGFQSIVRLYQDIFLVYDKNIYKWCLAKIIVP